KDIHAENTISVYPNPFSDKCYISVKGIDQSENLTITIYDILGNLVFSKKSNPSPLITIDRNNLSAGTYFLVLTNNRPTVRKKLIIE
ncbi:MAG TPA: T9SS type A sorting domain-containing protein, partial [Nitrosopumilaceae archaeon]|nr:T9SS type A sorting domain-containing protein [Nitrosopumilaceae archaeon]